MKTALEIIKVVRKWIEDGNQFTCWDVTKQVRDNGFTLDHQDTRTLVHGLHEIGSFAESFYDRHTTSFTTKDGKHDTAEVYRASTDLNSYDPDWLDEDEDDDNIVVVNIAPAVTKAAVLKACGICGDASNHGKNPAPTPPPAPPAAPLPKPSTNKKYKVDRRGRICVRQDLIKHLALDYTNRIFLHNDNGNLVLSSKVLPKTLLGSLMVDKNQNVRISRHLQEKAGIKATEFSMTRNGNTVVVSA